MFKRNYFYELPDDIQSVIYRNVFSNCIRYFANDRSIKYLNRLYRAVNNPSNTCVYYIPPKGMFGSDSGEYKYKHLAVLEGFRTMNELIYLDRKHLLEDTTQPDCDTISCLLYTSPSPRDS